MCLSRGGIELTDMFKTLGHMIHIYGGTAEKLPDCPGYGIFDGMDIVAALHNEHEDTFEEV